MGLDNVFIDPKTGEIVWSNRKFSQVWSAMGLETEKGLGGIRGKVYNVPIEYITDSEYSLYSVLTQRDMLELANRLKQVDFDQLPDEIKFYFLGGRQEYENLIKVLEYYGKRRKPVILVPDY